MLTNYEVICSKINKNDKIENISDDKGNKYNVSTKPERVYSIFNDFLLIQGKNKPKIRVSNVLNNELLNVTNNVSFNNLFLK